MKKTRISYFHLALSLILACGSPLFADVTVTPGTGGSAISADTAGGSYTLLTGPKVTEKDKTGAGIGSIILTAPAGFEFDPSASVSVAVTGNRRGTDLVLSNSIATVTTNTITVFVSDVSNPNSRRSSLTWSGIKVRPHAGTPLVTGNITQNGSSYSGTTNNYGTLTTVPGAMSHLVVVLSNQTFTAGSGVSGTPEAAIAGVPFTLKRIIATDQFMNIFTNYNGAHTISYTGPGGTPTYTTNVIFTNGQSSTLLITTLPKAEVTTLTASDGTTTGPASSPLTVNRRAFTKLQLLVPGESAAPGTLTGKTGTPTPQTAGALFPVSVRAVDDNWDLVEIATDTVGITVSDPNSTLPDNAALTAGTGTFTVVMMTAGAHSITASDISSPTITSNTSPLITLLPASFQKLQLLVPGETAMPGTLSGKSGTPLDQTVGSAFTVTVHAVDMFWNVVPVADFVGLTASDANATLPINAALAAGSQTFSVTLNTLGTFTITATDLSNATITNHISPPITVAAGLFTKLQLLVPGETAAPGSLTGKTGAPLAQSAGVSFPVTITAVDDHWNPINTVADTVHFISSDGSAGLPIDGELVGGFKTFNVTFSTAGLQTLTVSDVTQADKTPCTSSVIPVGSTAFTPATGGQAISADTVTGAYTCLDGPIIIEGAPGNIGTGTLILTLPAGFVMNTSTTVLAGVTGSGVGSDIVLESSTATVSATTISITVTHPSSGNRVSTLTWAGIQVRPLAGAPLAGGAISNSGTAILAGIPQNTNFGMLTETPGSAARLTIQTQPSPTATAGVVFAQQPVIRVEDQFGNLCTTDNSTVVTAARDTGSGILQGSLSTITVNGTATFANLSHQVAGSITLAFNAPGLTGAQSDSLVVYPGTPNQLAFVQPPTHAVAGVTIAPAVTVQVKDGFGNEVPDTGIQVSLSLSSGSGILSGTTSNLTGATGLAVFSDLNLGVAGLKQLTASAPALASVVSDTFMIAPAAASQLVFLQPPTNAVAGATIAPVVTVQMKDAFGNDATNSGIQISLSLNTGLGILAGTLTKVTDIHGTTRFDDLSLAVAGEKTLTASSDGLTPALSGVFTISPGVYMRVQLLVPGETAAPGTTPGKIGTPSVQIARTSFPVRINAVDAFWNIVNTATNWVDIYSTSDIHATLPASAALVAGSQTFNVAFSAGGNQTLTAEDVFDDAIGDDTSPEILVVVTYFTMQIVSTHGTGSPEPGIYTNGLNAVLTNSVSGTVTQGGTQYVCTGWVMTGNTPQSGTSNHFVMTVTNNSGLTWLWTTNYQFSATAGANGGVFGATNGWYALGGTLSVTAAPMPYYYFAGWTGDSLGSTPTTPRCLY